LKPGNNYPNSSSFLDDRKICNIVDIFSLPTQLIRVFLKINNNILKICCSTGCDEPEEDLAKFGYDQRMKVERFIDPPFFGYSFQLEIESY
jgi:hypothetical protein